MESIPIWNSEYVFNQRQLHVECSKWNKRIFRLKGAGRVWVQLWFSVEKTGSLSLSNLCRSPQGAGTRSPSFWTHSVISGVQLPVLKVCIPCFLCDLELVTISFWGSLSSSVPSDFCEDSKIIHPKLLAYFMADYKLLMYVGYNYFFLYITTSAALWT